MNEMVMRFRRSIRDALNMPRGAALPLRLRADIAVNAAMTEDELNSWPLALHRRRDRIGSAMTDLFEERFSGTVPSDVAPADVEELAIDLLAIAAPLRLDHAIQWAEQIRPGHGSDVVSSEVERTASPATWTALVVRALIADTPAEFRVRIRDRFAA